MPKSGYFKAEGLNIGWVGKIRNNRNFRIIGQGSEGLFFDFKIFIYALDNQPFSKDRFILW